MTYAWVTIFSNMTHAWVTIFSEMANPWVVTIFGEIIYAWVNYFQQTNGLNDGWDRGKARSVDLVFKVFMAMQQ